MSTELHNQGVSINYLLTIFDIANFEAKKNEEKKLEY